MAAIPAPDERAQGYAGAIPGTAQGSRLGLALVVIASAQLMVVLDATIRTGPPWPPRPAPAGTASEPG